MAQGAKPVPEGYRTVTPYLVVRGAAQAIDFYRRAFGAEEVTRSPALDGQRILHAELKIGDSRIMLSDEFPDMGMGCRSPEALGGTTAGIHLYVEDADATFERARAAGATVSMPLMDMFWGDRYGKMMDPFGHEWSIATHVEDLSPGEQNRRARAAFAKVPG